MFEDGFLTQQEMNAYIASEKIKTTVKVKVDNPDVGQRVGSFLYGEKEVYINRKVIVDGLSKFQKDIESSMKFNKQGLVEAPDLDSLKDQILFGFSQISSELGFPSLSEACRHAMSVDSQEKINKIEAGTANMIQRISEQAKQIGFNIDNQSKATRIVKQAQNIVATKQKQDSGRSI